MGVKTILEQSPAGSYNDLEDIPKINGVPLAGDMSPEDLGLVYSGSGGSGISPEDMRKLYGYVDDQIGDIGNILDCINRTVI